MFSRLACMTARLFVPDLLSHFTHRQMLVILSSFVHTAVEWDEAIAPRTEAHAQPLSPVERAQRDMEEAETRLEKAQSELKEAKDALEAADNELEKMILSHPSVCAFIFISMSKRQISL